MLNFQIRGLKLESYVGGLSKFEVSDMMDLIKVEKKPLTELLLKENKFGLWKNFDDVLKIESPLLISNSELQITYFDEDDYYHDGYTFYRSNPKKLKKTESELVFELPESEYLIINTGIFYGNCFETDLKDESYEFFTPEDIFLDSVKVSWSDKRYINKIFFKDLELVNNKKRKEQIIQLTTMIIKPELNRSSLKVNDMNLIQRSDKIYESDTQL
tara:strand:+ start:652 stop:1296 length:645 start_codon:yes stop_codon:yes gene_type:complete